MKVKNFENNKKQFIIENEENTFFQSYDSMIAKIDDVGVLWLGADWGYSVTTLKYLYKFINEYKYKMNSYIYNILSNFQDIKNKKQYIQKLIDDNIISIITL